jgi:hypothetical protein
METSVNVRIKRTVEEVLLANGYLSEIQSNNIILVGLKNIKAKLIIIEENKKLYFQLDVLPLNEIYEDVNIYKELLKLNYDIVPLAMAIDATDREDNILIITTTLEVENLDENELMNVIINFEDAIEKAIVTLKNYYVDDLELNEGEVSGIY